MEIKDDTSDNCLKAKSLKEGPTKLDSKIFPGIFYCKFLSPARVIEYYMTDGLKSKSTCLNTNSSIEDVIKAFLQWSLISTTSSLKQFLKITNI